MKDFLKKILLSLPFLTLLGITLLDTVWLALGRVPEMVRLLRDGVLLAALLMLVPLYTKITWLQERRVFAVLRKSFLLLITGFCIVALTGRYLSSLNADPGRHFRLYAATDFFFLGTLAALLATMLHLALLALLRTLVLYKSKASTLRNFRLLALAILVFAAVSSALGMENFRAGSPFEAGPMGAIAFALVVVLIVLNGFRASWITFLNRRQKWIVLLATIASSVFGVFVTLNVRESFLADYSIAYAATVSAISLFVAVYAGISSCLLLLSLPTAGLFDEKIHAIKSLQEVTQSISHFMEKGRLMDSITQRAVQVTKSDFAWLELLNDKQTELSLGSSVHLSEQEKAALPLGLNGGLSGWVVQHQKGLLINDVKDDGRAQHLTEWKKNIGALLAVPLISREHIFGVLFSAKRDYFSYDQFDQDMLQAFADQAAIAFENAHLLNESLEKERLAQELRVAQEAQKKLLPKDMPVVPGIEVSGVSVAAYEVGGDYFDVFKRGDKLAVVVGDVSGKGTAAAFYMAEVKGVIEALGKIYESPREVLVHANQILGRSLERNAFISLIYAVFDPDSRRMSLGRAGHTPLLWCPHNGEPTFLQPRGMGIGMDRSVLFELTLEEISLGMSPGDNFIFYTDGVVEARDSRNREFEEKMLLHVVKQKKFDKAKLVQEEILRHLRAHVGSSRAHDDFTLVVVGIHEIPETVPAFVPAQAGTLPEAGVVTS
jgi:serine phosphatase RsbU (regulator of sigma subunit)